MEIISQLPDLSQSANSRSSLVVTFSETGDDKFFVHIDTTTFVVNFLHTNTSVNEFTARYSVYCHFSVRPSAVIG